MRRKYKIITITFYKLSSGNEPVKIWLKGLGKQSRQVVGEDLKTLEYGWPVGMPLCRSFGDGLFEVRSNLPGRKIARVIFCIYENNIVLLHGFIKKAQKTLLRDLQLAKRRNKELKYD